MIVVIQCASSKRQDAGHLVTPGGKIVHFVAHPEMIPVDCSYVYARPDDLNDRRTWRQELLAYNATPGRNPLGLYPAYELYDNYIYGRLVDRYGVKCVYILSAGWGLIRADFLTPHYDITFSQAAAPYKRRKKTDRYEDFCMLAEGTQEEIVFFGGNDYLPLFDVLTSRCSGRRVVFYNSQMPPAINRVVLKRFPTTRRTNWHYGCADAFLDGDIS
jgi:hypothetical protein